METNMRSLEISPQFRKSKSSCGNSLQRAHYKYTSLKDILDAPGGRGHRRKFNSIGNELLPGIDPSAINIRNPLMKHAATVYLQSAALIATRDPSFKEGVWLRQDERSNWGCVGDIFGIVREYVVRFLASGQQRNFTCHGRVH